MKIKKLLGSVAASALAIGATTATAFAASYTPITGGDVTFSTTLTTEGGTAGAKVFKATVAPGTAVAATATTQGIKAGVGTPTIADVDLTQGTEGTIDLSPCTYTEPGIYRYTITGGYTVGGKDNVAVVDSGNTRTLDVYVVDDGGTLKVAATLLHTGTDAPALEATGDGQYALDDKVDGFSGKLSADDEITIMKKVTGNQGDKSKKFTFTLEIKKAIPNFTYTLGDTTLVTDGDGNGTATFKLADGESVKMVSLINGAEYTVTEDADGYKSTAKIAGVAEGETAGTLGTSDKIKTGYTNDKSGVIPTGILINNKAAVATVLAGGVVAFMIIKKKREVEAE